MEYEGEASAVPEKSQVIWDIGDIWDISFRGVSQSFQTDWGSLLSDFKEKEEKFGFFAGNFRIFYMQNQGIA